ncbi:MAG: hypothetical protein IT173_01620 [Acidobacteria bacterium]|nr:hypothetical protein [Acidobacteriota bacterium]
MHDANDNAIQKSEGSSLWRYKWDYENRFTEASTGKSEVRYKYHALGRRVERNFNQGKEWRKFTHDGLDVLVDDDAGTLTKYQNGPGIDSKLTVQNGSNVSYFLADHLGSTNGLADQTGNLTSQTAYDSFGNPTAILGTRYQFTGREYDAFSGLQFSRARFYDQKLGRFVSEDPIGFNGGDLNLYGYVRNRPLERRDPMGLDDADIAFRQTAEYRHLEELGREVWRDMPIPPRRAECGPTGNRYLEFLVPDSLFGRVGNRYSITPACESHDTCYSTCGMPKSSCDNQLGSDVTRICLQNGGTVGECAVFGGLYNQGVSRFGSGAYGAAQVQSGCTTCSLPLKPPPRDPCSNFGDWRCK